jgi:short chain dehydrogenase
VKVLSVESRVNGIPMSGKTVLITGATSGLGLATALLLAEQGAEVVMVGRDRTRGNFMRAEIAKYAAGNVPILFLADLSSQEEIYQLAEKLHGSFSRIDVLINNAAAMFADREVTPEGLEKTFAINHLAPFILTHLVLDLIRAAPAGRILTASSEFHSGTLDFSNLHAQARKRGSGAKAVRGNRRSCQLYRRSPDNLRGLPTVFPWIVKRIPSLLAFPERAAITPVYVASSPDLKVPSSSHESNQLVQIMRECREILLGFTVVPGPGASV